MRESPAVSIITALQDVGAKVRAYDPQGMDHAKSILDGVEYAHDPYACAEGADVLVVMTEWAVFRSLDLGRLKTLLKRPVVVDLRNIFRPEAMAEHGFTYVSVGRPKVEAPQA
jgi:UDPglucose 6-dehydrogenase